MPTRHHPSTLPATLTSLSTRAASLLRDLDDLTTYNTETVARYERHAARDDLLRAETKLSARVALADYARRSIRGREAALAKELAGVQRAAARSAVLLPRLKVLVAQVRDVSAAVAGYFGGRVFSAAVVRALEASV